MKAMLQISKILFVATLALGQPMLSVAGDKDGDVEKKKSYSKSYSLSPADNVKLTNSFGEIKVNTWAKNEIKVDVEIIVKASTDAKAQETLDKISIEDGKNGNEVFFKTKIGKSDEKDEKKTKVESKEMKINYTVYLPSSQTLAVHNSFGSTLIPDYTGILDLTSKFGALTAGKLSKAKTVSVDFGYADIQSIENCKVSAKYSNTEIRKMGGEMNLDFSFCKDVKLEVDNSLSKLDIKNSYSTLDIKLSKDLSANFQVKTSFGAMVNKTSFEMKEEVPEERRRGAMFSHNYKGTAGAGKIPIVINSSFGGINFLNTFSKAL